MKHTIDKSIRTAISTILFLFICAAHCFSADWPQYGHDSKRSFQTDEAMPSTLQLQWSRQLATPSAAWPKGQEKLQFDSAYAPIVVGEIMFVASMVSDSVTAYNTDSGEEQWRFYTDGPVRFAPVAWGDRVAFASDDGYLYCVSADTGKLVWKVSGAPRNNKIIGNHRLISSWPARGGPALLDGKIYFGAGIWPFMGVFIYCIDADTGKTLWVNSNSGTTWMNQPHGGAGAFSGVSAHGYIAASDERVIVPTGRSTPAGFDAKTGEYLFFLHAENKSSGGFEATISGNYFYNNNKCYNLENGQNNRQGPSYWKNEESCMLKADGKTYSCDGGKIVDEQGKVIATFEGVAWNVILANEKLYISTYDGKIYCFATASSANNKEYTLAQAAIIESSKYWQAMVKTILTRGVDNHGYCLVLGLGGEQLIESLIKQSEMHIIVIEADALKLNKWRTKMDQAGLYGNRVTALCGSPFSSSLPPYIADMIISEDIDAAGFTSAETSPANILNSLRPYGGIAYLFAKPEKISQIFADFKKVDINSVTIQSGKKLIQATRRGALLGAGSWTHHYSDAGNSLMSQDSLVKTPLGLLWFGGPSNDAILPRHGHGPSPEIVGGRLFIEGADILRAVDVYTGRLLWEKKKKNIGAYYDNTAHHPGAGAIGGNYVSLADAVYLMSPEACYKLDPATGKTVQTFTMPKKNGKMQKWSSLRIIGDLLIATAGPMESEGSASYSNRLPDFLKKFMHSPDYSTTSKTLVVINRHTGKILWERNAESGFRHNAIAAGDNKLFCIDYIRDPENENAQAGTIYALDATTGKLLWKTTTNVYGTWLGYAAEHKLLVQAGSSNRDRAPDESRQGISVYKSQTGKIVWEDLEQAYNGPLLLWKDELITNGNRGYGINIKTGAINDWSWARSYGCNTAIASLNLLTFRSGAAGFYDLSNHGGTGNIGGFKAGCTSNIIPADGVLNAPDYTRTCSCSYQNQTSLAMVHMPDVEVWTFGGELDDNGRIGLNFGAPGNRKDDHGTFWQAQRVAVNQPTIGPRHFLTNTKVYMELPDSQFENNVSVAIDAASNFRHHSLMLKDGELNWVAASGVNDIRKLTIDLPEGIYNIKLYFCEPINSTTIGKRVFDVSIQGKKVLDNLDITKEAGGTLTGIVKEFKAIDISTALELTFTADTGSAVISGIELVKQ